jgi:hypothetical protein
MEEVNLAHIEGGFGKSVQHNTASDSNQNDSFKMILQHSLTDEGPLH